MNQKRNWTKDEDSVILRAVKENPQQELNVTFLTLSEQLGRSFYSVQKRYSIIKQENRKRGRCTVWNKEAQQKLIRAVKDNPYNRQEAFRKVAAELNISISTVSHYWYANDFEVCTLAFSPKKMFKNRTSYVEGKNTYAPTTPKNRFWNRIKEIFGL